MLHWLRRSRLLAVLLLAASPAAGGTLLPAIHPCPVDAPWLAAKQPMGGHHAAHTAPASSHQHDLCNCLGGCVAATAAVPPTVSTLSVPAPGRPVTVSWVSVDASLDLAPPSTFLPPAIAPPLV